MGREKPIQPAARCPLERRRNEDSRTMPGPTAPALALFPLNDTFLPKVIALVGHVKIGRQTSTKTVPNERNGYFDTKVLSRQHAEVWEEGGKVWIKDVKSSNGTFINSIRLSPEGVESDPFELHTDDIVEFGIDIVGEDSKTIIHHKVAARCTCILNSEDAATFAVHHPAAAPQTSQQPQGQQQQQHQQQQQQYHLTGQPIYPFAPRRPALSMDGMGGPPPVPRARGGPSLDLIFARLQSELARSREVASELNHVSGAMGEIQETLGTSLPPANALAPLPIAGISSANVKPTSEAHDVAELAILRSRVDEMQSWVKSLPVADRDEVAALRREVEMLRVSQIQNHHPTPLHTQQQLPAPPQPQGQAASADERESASPPHVNGILGREGAVSPVARLLEEDDDAQSIATLVPDDTADGPMPRAQNALLVAEKDARIRAWAQEERAPDREAEEEAESEGWPDEPPPLARVPRDIQGAGRSAGPSTPNDEHEPETEPEPRPLAIDSAEAAASFFTPPPPAPEPTPEPAQASISDSALAPVPAPAPEQEVEIPQQTNHASDPESPPSPPAAGLSMRKRNGRARLQPKTLRERPHSGVLDEDREKAGPSNEELVRQLDVLRTAIGEARETIVRLEERVRELEARPSPAPAPAPVLPDVQDLVDAAIARESGKLIAGEPFDAWREERANMRKAVEEWERMRSSFEDWEEIRRKAAAVVAPPSPKSLSGSGSADEEIGDEKERTAPQKLRRRRRRRYETKGQGQEPDGVEVVSDDDEALLTPSSLSSASAAGSVSVGHPAPMSTITPTVPPDPDPSADTRALQRQGPPLPGPPVAVNRTLTTLMLAICVLLLLSSMQSAVAATGAIACAVGLWAVYARAGPGAVAAPGT